MEEAGMSFHASFDLTALRGCHVDAKSPEKPITDVDYQLKLSDVTLSSRGRSQKSDIRTTTKLPARAIELAKRFEAALGDQWVNDAGKWIGRIKSDPAKSERVIAEVESAAREGRIKTTPAQYAEHIWEEFR